MPTVCMAVELLMLFFSQEIKRGRGDTYSNLAIQIFSHSFTVYRDFSSLYERRRNFSTMLDDLML